MRRDRNRAAGGFQRGFALRPIRALAPLAIVLAAAAASPPPPAASAMTMNDARIVTNQTNLNIDTGNFTMPGHVTLSRPGSDAVADRAHGNEKKGTIALVGHVVVHDNGSGQKSLAGEEPGGNGPATLEADEVDVDTTSRLYQAHGHVHFTQGTRSGSADNGVLDRGKGTLHLEGSVTLNDGPQASVTASSIDDDLVRKDVVIHGTPAVLKQTPEGGGEPDSVTTNELHWNQNSGDFTMPGKATFKRTGTDATGDSASGNTKRATLSLRGNVLVHDNGGAPEAQSEKGYGGKGPATLTCDALDVDGKRRTYVAKGNVDFKQADETMHADLGTLDRSTGKLHLEGNVKMTQAASSMTARVVDYNLNTKDVRVTGAPVIIRQPAPSPRATATPKSKRKLPFP